MMKGIVEEIVEESVGWLGVVVRRGLLRAGAISAGVGV